MLMPKRVKYRKPHSHPRIKGPAKRGTSIAFGDYALKALEPHWVTARQIESARVTIGRHMKKGGKLWLRVFPDKAVTKHPAETRMGKGKGGPDHWVVVIRPGRILFEIQGLTREDAEKALRTASFKLPIRTQFVVREQI